MDHTLFSDWARNCLVQESRFAHAYENTPDIHRAWMKKSIAQHFAWFKEDFFCRSLSQVWSQGFESLHFLQPRDWALVFLSEVDRPSSAHLLGALMPLLTSGISYIAVWAKSEEESLSEDLLTAMELAGLENVYQGGDQEWNNFKKRLLEKNSSGLQIEFIKDTSFKSRDSFYKGKRKKVLKREFFLPLNAGIWMEGEKDFDLKAFELAHPGMQVHLWSEFWISLELPKHWQVHKGKFEDFLSQDWEFVLVPKSRFRQAAEKFKLTLGPGQEGFWIWPEFSYSDCFLTRLGVQDSEY